MRAGIYLAVYRHVTIGI